MLLMDLIATPYCACIPELGYVWYNVLHETSNMISQIKCEKIPFSANPLNKFEKNFT